MNQQILLVRRPEGAVRETDFSIVDAPMPSAPDDGVVVRNRFLSLDPYMRGRLNNQKSYAEPQPLNQVMIGGTVGEVIESKAAALPVGTSVVGAGGWQLYASGTAKEWRKVDPKLPLSVYLGAAGMPGVTAWIGLVDIGQPKPGETVVVSSAAGAVGSVVGQLAKARECRAVGIAGGADKCRYVTEELGFDTCVDYKAGDLFGQLKAATPNGVDVYFENVGGEIFDVVVRRLNPFARLPLCGWISGYDTDEPYAVKNATALLVSRVKLQGFVVTDHLDRWGPALVELTQRVAGGSLKYKESVTDGLESAPRALIGLLHGANFGKQLVRLA